MFALDSIMKLSVAILFGPCFFFLLGSIPFGFLAGKMNGLDLRKEGSGNIGATNVGRVLGPSWGRAVFAADFFKGFFPLYLLRSDLIAPWLVTQFPLALSIHRTSGCNNREALTILFIILGFCAVLGHNYTPWLGFKGGKGIAVSAGILTALMPVVLAIAFTLWFVVLKLSRTVSLASIAACLTLPFVTFVLHPHRISLILFALLVGISGLWRHRANIERLRNGTEPQIGKKKNVSSEETIVS